MNLVVIGNNTDEICLDIWKNNTNFTVLNKNPYLWGSDFIKFIEDNPVIVSTNTEQFINKSINDFIEYMRKYNFIPIFIADDCEDFVNIMYTAINDIIQDSVLFKRNENNEGYELLLKITKEYLFKRNDENDKIIRTPRKRKTGSTKK